MKAKKNDQGKPPVELLSRAALEGCAKVLAFGAEEYGADNWRKGHAWRRLIGAALRHLLAFSDGENLDAQSGLPHVDHLLCCAMFLSESQKLGLGVDNRYKREEPRQRKKGRP